MNLYILETVGSYAAGGTVIVASSLEEMTKHFKPQNDSELITDHNDCAWFKIYSELSQNYDEKISFDESNLRIDRAILKFSPPEKKSEWEKTLKDLVQLNYQNAVKWGFDYVEMDHALSEIREELCESTNKTYLVHVITPENLENCQESQVLSDIYHDG